MALSLHYSTKAEQNAILLVFVRNNLSSLSDSPTTGEVLPQSVALDLRKRILV